MGAPIIFWLTLQVKPFNQVKIRQSIGFCVGEATLFFMWDHLSKLLDNRYIDIDQFLKSINYSSDDLYSPFFTVKPIFD